MTKNELYDKLMTAYHRHQKNNTLCVTYTDQVIKLVKQYLAEKEPDVEVDQSVIDYWANDVKHMKELDEWKNNQWNY